MLSQAQKDKLAEIAAEDGFVQFCNNPEADAANRVKPSPAPVMYIGAEGFQSVRIGVSGNLLSAKIS